MKDIKIVVGANWGDEGKGLMADYFSQKPNSIVVCSNGGAQRGHTVVTSTGIRHVFHHFGSGTFNQADTYLSEDFICNPIIFKQEYNELKQLGYCPNIYINQHCMVTTPYDMMANQIIEENRGKNKHGSCGLGIYETIKRYKAGVTTLYVSDYIRDYYLKIFDREGIVLTKKWEDLFNDSGIYDHYLEDWDFMNEIAAMISDECFLNEYENIVFEAAQGLLLDQNNLKYYPHLTPSNTGIKNPKKIIENVKWDDDINIETCYVSRTYLTRHGAGQFPSECDKSLINQRMYDKTNVPNPHQDTLRYGLLDLDQLYDRCMKDVEGFGHKKSMVFTHINEYSMSKKRIKNLFDDWGIYFSDGETHNDIYRINN